MSRSKSSSVFSWFKSNALEKEKEIIFSVHFADTKETDITDIATRINKHKNSKAYTKLMNVMKDIVLNFSNGELREKVLNDWTKNDKVDDPSFYLKYKFKIITLYHHLQNGNDKKGGKSKRRSKTNKNKTKRRYK